MTTPEKTHKGQCLCGGVRYEITGPLRPVIACHCSQCRRTSGHFLAATEAPTSAIKLTAAETLTWYASSEFAKRGFCNRCGGNLFWRELDASKDRTSIMAGTLDPPTNLRIEKHIYVADKSDYYSIDDDARQWEQNSAE